MRVGERAGLAARQLLVAWSKYFQSAPFTCAADLVIFAFDIVGHAVWPRYETLTTSLIYDALNVM